MAEPHATPTAAAATRSAAANGTPPAGQPHIIVRDLTMAFGSFVLMHDLNFTVRRGDVFIIMGGSGCGKSTLLRHLIGLIEPAKGEIFYGEQNFTTAAPQVREQILRRVGILYQSGALFSSMTLAENIAYGRAGASRRDIERASEAAGLHDFIRDLPEGYETAVGERGVRLSGGQRQRLSIARAFLKDAPILLLDEPTSNLDATTERHIFESIDRLARGRTTLVVSHRLVTARRADRIVVLAGGRIVEQGQHEALLSAGGAYARLYRDQAGHRAASAASLREARA